MRKMIFGLLALATSAAAQDPAYRRFLEQTNAAAPAPPLEAIRPEALAILQGAMRAQRRCVPGALALERLASATAMRAVTLSVRSGEVRNGWTVYGRATSCGAPLLFRFLVLRLPDNALRVLIVNEGESLANPSLMRDTSTAAVQATLAVLRRTMPSCNGQDVQLGPSRVVSRGAGLGPNVYGAFFRGTWREAWTFRMCGRRVEMPIDFTADAEGGADYSVHGSEARILP
jgi:hypothetical protein